MDVVKNAWDSAWKKGGNKQWDIGAAHPALLSILKHTDKDSSPLIPNGTAFVPACGVGYDCFALHIPKKRKVVGLDISTSAINRAIEKRNQLKISEVEVKFVVDNFFEFQHEGGFDVIYDPHFLCALEPSKRTEWAKKMKLLLKKDGCLITLIYPAYTYERVYAPYTVTPQIVRMKSILEPEGFKDIYLKMVDTSPPGREKLEWLGVWKLN